MKNERLIVSALKKLDSWQPEKITKAERKAMLENEGMAHLVPQIFGTVDAASLSASAPCDPVEELALQVTVRVEIGQPYLTGPDERCDPYDGRIRRRFYDGHRDTNPR